MNAAPTPLDKQELDALSGSSCPTCGVEKAGKTPGMDWVECPMAGGQAICYGCCLDFQGLVRSDDLATNPFNGLLNDLGSKMNKSIVSLREVCLSHQETAVHLQLRDPRNRYEQKELLTLLDQVRAKRDSISKSRSN